MKHNVIVPTQIKRTTNTTENTKNMNTNIHSFKPSAALAAGAFFLALALGGYVWLSVRSTLPPAPARHKPAMTNHGVESELQELRKAASSDFQYLAITHEKEAHERLANAVQLCVDRSRSRVDSYAEWLLSYEATFAIVKAWYNNSLDSEMARFSQEKLLSQQELIDSLNSEAERLQADMAGKADVISSNYQDRVATVLARFDCPTLPTDPQFATLTLLTNRLKTAAIVGNASGISSFVGSMLVGSFAEKRFVTWLGEKLALKAGSKLIRWGTGPVGWVVGLTIGLGAEWAADKYLFKPHMVTELNSQLDNVQSQMLRAGGPVSQTASAQADLVRTIAAELAGSADRSIAQQ